MRNTRDKDVFTAHAVPSDTKSGRTNDGGELLALQPRGSQHNPGNEIPEEHWMYRFAKKHWFFGFGAYT